MPAPVGWEAGGRVDPSDSGLRREHLRLDVALRAEGLVVPSATVVVRRARAVLLARGKVARQRRRRRRRWGRVKIRAVAFTAASAFPAASASIRAWRLLCELPPARAPQMVHRHRRQIGIVVPAARIIAHRALRVIALPPTSLLNGKPAYAVRTAVEAVLAVVALLPSRTEVHRHRRRIGIVVPAARIPEHPALRIIALPPTYLLNGKPAYAVRTAVEAVPAVVALLPSRLRRWRG